MLIELEDGILVEVDAPLDFVQPMSSDSAERVNKTIEALLTPILKKTAQSIKAVWTELNKDMVIEKAEIELGLGFEFEGSVFIAKAKTNSSLSVKLCLVAPEMHNDSLNSKY